VGAGAVPGPRRAAEAEDERPSAGAAVAGAGRSERQPPASPDLYGLRGLAEVLAGHVAEVEGMEAERRRERDARRGGAGRSVPAALAEERRRVAGDVGRAVEEAEGAVARRAGEVVALLENDLDGILRPALRDVRADLLDKADAMLLRLEAAGRGLGGSPGGAG